MSDSPSKTPKRLLLSLKNSKVIRPCNPFFDKRGNNPIQIQSGNDISQEERYNSNENGRKSSLKGKRKVVDSCKGIERTVSLMHMNTNYKLNKTYRQPKPIRNLNISSFYSFFYWKDSNDRKKEKKKLTISTNFAICVQNPWSTLKEVNEQKSKFQMCDLKIHLSRKFLEMENLNGNQEMEKETFKSSRKKEKQEKKEKKKKQTDLFNQKAAERQMGIMEKEEDLALVKRTNYLGLKETKREKQNIIDIGFNKKDNNEEKLLNFLKNNFTSKELFKTSNEIITKRNDFSFKTLYLFLNLFFIHREYKPCLIDFFTDNEILVFCKFINFPHYSVERFKNSMTQVLFLSDRVFNGVEVRKRGYKVTNNKRFIFRKVRQIMLIKLTKSKQLKKEKDKFFFHYYFSSQEEFSSLNIEDMSVLKTILMIYEEKKIDLIWRFELFRKDFISVFREFRKWLASTYFKNKLIGYRRFLLRLEGKDADHIKNIQLPFKKLPVNHNRISEYMNDFERGFEDVFKS